MENLNKLLMGDFDVSLDEAGRIAIPRDLRNALEPGKVVLTRGVNLCIRMYSAEEFLKRTKDVDVNADTDTVGGLEVLRRNIGYAHAIEIDKQGRILVSPTLRDFAGLSKDCKVVGMLRFIEIWDKERHQAHENSQDTYSKRSEEFARKKESKNNGNRTHSGTVGGNDTVSGAEGQG